MFLFVCFVFGLVSSGRLLINAPITWWSQPRPLRRARRGVAEQTQISGKIIQKNIVEVDNEMKEGKIDEG